jgi:hypothetical protein
MKKTTAMCLFCLFVFVSISQSMPVNQWSSNSQYITTSNIALSSFLNISFTKHIVDDNFDYAFGVSTYDIDGDGDCDILGAEKDGDAVAWWCNTGDDPIQWTKFIIDNHFDGATSVFPADIDGDFDIDVVGSAWNAQEIAWWRNDGGNPIQWTKYSIRTGFDFAHEVFCCDLDKDGKIDVLGASTDDNQIAWWRNMGGDPVRWIEGIIDNDFIGAKSVRAAEIDNDNVLEVVGAAILDNKIVWWDHTPNGPSPFEEHSIDDNFQGAHRIEVCDMDNDGSIDVVGAAYFGNEIAWWRNNGEDPVPWTKHIITTGFNGACIGLPVDLDGDNDIDIVGTAQYTNEVAWFRNDGDNSSTWIKFTIDQNFGGAWPCSVSDMDGDGDIDIVAGASFADELAWWENDLSQSPEKPIRPSGSKDGKKGQEYSYTTSTTDPNGDQVYYFWDWGDGNNSGWLGPYDSGVTCEAKHIWNGKGNYDIKVKAKDIYEKESAWSEPLPITMPFSFNKPMLRFSEWLFQRFLYPFPLL